MAHTNTLHPSLIPKPPACTSRAPASSQELQASSCAQGLSRTRAFRSCSAPPQTPLPIPKGRLAGSANLAEYDWDSPLSGIIDKQIMCLSFRGEARPGREGLLYGCFACFPNAHPGLWRSTLGGPGDEAGGCRPLEMGYLRAHDVACSLAGTPEAMKAMKAMLVLHPRP